MKIARIIAILSIMSFSGKILSADLYNVKIYDFEAKKFTYPIINSGIHLKRIEKDLLLSSFLQTLECLKGYTRVSFFKDVASPPLHRHFFFEAII